MSVLLNGNQQMPDIPGTIGDTLVIFSGWEKNNLLSYATPLPYVRGTQISAVDLWLDADESSPAGQPLWSTGLYGILSSAPTDVCPVPDDISLTPISASTLQAAWGFIELHFDPRGRLIIYGNSAGGDCALNLCRAICQCKSWYTYGGSAGSSFGSDLNAPGVIGEVRIDLLITADAAAGPASNFISRSVPSCVIRNVNYYQTTSKWDEQWSHGAPAVADDPQQTTIVNEDWSDRADHYAMGWMTRQEALDAINACRGI